MYIKIASSYNKDIILTEKIRTCNVAEKRKNNTENCQMKLIFYRTIQMRPKTLTAASKVALRIPQKKLPINNKQEKANSLTRTYLKLVLQTKTEY